MKILELIASLVVRLLDYFEERKRTKAAKQKQADYDAIKKNPVDWANNHFNGVRDGSEVPDDADKASEANSDSSKKR